MSQSRRGTRSSPAPATNVCDDGSKSVDDSSDQDQEESGEFNASVASPPPPPATFNYIINDSPSTSSYPPLPILKNSSSEKFNDWKEKPLSLFERIQVKPDSVIQESKDSLSLAFIRMEKGRTPLQVLDR